ncbi:helix-turn-helix transcriptional regulator [Mesorhizobium sp. M1E.F.Ca.ET.041.01.1.1]|uniref:helix-turn-helix transcriptional regulator n=1 Tax=Mesorhizobium sp. M1E.F.Ca.ET.041.01.1.1 TaxID=2496759 RepID=UPI000FCBE030|nr:helix-turn-helix transcriptional regulator [Mesorhizobium sp. M1E.F.Ca.ET.041.01.1.1]RUW19714.1 AraC family transcriptional regulator [Mesorhizobium sp. M1E.F.Ca.ET.041.01.1.1]RWD81415.1 MAG: AraC family transcriptional regulator [Mesorhizobium sp.]
MDTLEQIASAKEFEEVRTPPEMAGFGRRWIPPSEYASGHEDCFQIELSLLLTTKHFRMREECLENHRGTDRFVFLYHLDGRRTISPSNGEALELQKPTFVAYFHPKGVDAISQWSASQSETALALGFDPQDPPRVVAEFSEQLTVLQDLLRHPGGRFTWIELPLCSEMEKIARSVIFRSISQRFVHHYVSAKANELLCITLDNMISLGCIKSGAALSMSEKLDHIKNVLDGDLQNKLSICKLAEELNIPSRCFNKAFADRYGINAHDYRTMVRLSKAVDLLANTEMPLKMIAYEIGYGHASNFCLAFKKHYGYTPKEIRSGGLLQHAAE